MELLLAVGLERVSAEVEGWALAFLAVELGEGEQAAVAERYIEEGPFVRVVVVSSTLTVVVVEGVCIPASAGLSSLVEGCVEVVRNVHGLNLRNAKRCEDHYDFCYDCSLLLYLNFLVLHHCLRAAAVEDLGACFHLESFRRPTLQRRRQRQAEARQHFRSQRYLTNIVLGLARLLPIPGSRRRRMRNQQ